MLNIIGTATTAFTGIASVALFGSLAVETYVRIPQRIIYGSDPPLLPALSQESIFLIFPGYGGPDKNTERLEQVIADSDHEFRYDRKVFCYDWRNWRGNNTAAFFRASFDSQRVGRRIGQQLGAMQCSKTSTSTTTTTTTTVSSNDQRLPCQIKDIHVVGISAGAFAADACVKEYKRTLSKLYGKHVADATNARLTLLDPFTCRGVTGTKYGARYFGLDADYFENYFNSDDPVPFTNDPLPNAFNYDVTGSVQRSDFVPLPGDSMHSWPVAFYGRNWRKHIDARIRMKENGNSNNDNSSNDNNHIDNNIDNRRGGFFGPADHRINPRGVTIQVP